MKQLIEAIFGTYTPIVSEEWVEVDGVLTVVETVPGGAAGVDWAYVLGVLGFFLVLWCVLRILGGVIKRC